MRNRSLFFSLWLLTLLAAAPAMAETEEVIETTAEAADVSVSAAASASAETKTIVNGSGMLIEIGNTTAEETTLIVRVGSTDNTIQVNKNTKILGDKNRKSDLSDWIAGDQIAYRAEQGENSGELLALQLVNRSIKEKNKGQNGWVKSIDTGSNSMQIEWNRQIMTLDMSAAKMVAGAKNPASLSDFQVGDRIRARLSDDKDQDPATWKADIVVVLRRGDTLFMRVTRWVVPAEIVSIPADTSVLPYTIKAKVMESKFIEKGDVNNLIGEAGTEFDIEVTDKTLLVRRFMGKAMIGEFVEGDHIRVIGRLDDADGSLDAHLIKNNSIQRLGVSNRLSEVVSVDAAANTLVIRPIAAKNPLSGKRRVITDGMEIKVSLAKDAKVVENGETISLSDIQATDIIRVRGTFNRNQKSLSANAIAVVTDKLASTISE